jgi:outer membrane protein insertion porin family/translocation and assembly module TamA
LISGVACRAWPQRPVVGAIELTGADAVDTDPLVEGLATAETPLLFGVIPRILEYSTYDPSVLAKDLERSERWLRARGYYEAKVVAARVVHVDEHHVRVELDIHLGQLVRVRRVDPAGIARLPVELVSAAVSAVRIKPGDPFDEAAFEDDKKRLLRVLNDGGFAFAKVQAKGRVDIAEHAADVAYTVELGPRSTFGKVTIEGLGEIPEGPVRDTLMLRAGDAYSTSDVEDAQKALVNLGVFSSVEIQEDRSHPEAGVVPLTVRVREAKLRTLRLGGGGRFDSLRLSAHLRAGWEDRNFLGGMRRFSIDARPGLTFFPTRFASPLLAPTKVLPEFRGRVELRQPSFLEGRTTGFVRGEYNLFPVLYPLPDGVNPEDEPIVGYHQGLAATGVERAFFGQHLTIIPSYNWQANFPVSYQKPLQDGLEPIRVSFPELFMALDFRDDPIRTTRGVYISNELQAAGYVFGGTVDDLRIKPEVRVYTRGALGRKSVFAARATVGFLFPGNYGQTLNPTDAELADPTYGPENPDVVRDQQKLLMRAFYSGGPSSNRGYPYRSVGPHGPIGFLVPSNVNADDCRLQGRSVEDLPQGCIRPLGGLSLWELSLETRVPISESWEGVLFVDASDLTTDRGALRVNVPHISPGLGLRYITPVGPLRVDVGFRPPYLQHLGQKELDEEDGSPGEPFLGVLPVSLFLAIGEAF